MGPRAIWTLLVLGPEPRPSPGSWALGLAVLDILNFDRSQGCSHPSPLYTSATPGERTSGGPGAARGMPHLWPTLSGDSEVPGDRAWRGLEGSPLPLCTGCLPPANSAGLSPRGAPCSPPPFSAPPAGVAPVTLGRPAESQWGELPLMLRGSSDSRECFCGRSSRLGVFGLQIRAQVTQRAGAEEAQCKRTLSTQPLPPARLPHPPPRPLEAAIKGMELSLPRRAAIWPECSVTAGTPLASL